ncbi:MAG: DUF29 domain-containing protein [Alphaproteobacteria bacterium]|nr:DUF29 domain-containing protein [Alphaproteobacteria bacterium]
MAKSVARERRVGFRAQATAASRPKLYERDMYRWTRQQARLLRAGRMSELDLENLAEEIESLGNRDYRELQSRLELILTRLLKWQFQPERRSGSWRSTIRTQRRDTENLLQQSPGLRRQVAPMLAKSYVHAVASAADETNLPRDVFPRACPYAPEQVLDPDFMPKD